MARCQHPCVTLIYEGPTASHTRLGYGDSAVSQAAIQIYQCRHCHAVQSHAVMGGRAEVYDWKPLPFLSLPVRHQLHSILALARPPARCRSPEFTGEASFRRAAA